MNGYVNKINHRIYLERTAEINPSDKHLYIPITDLQCVYCEINRVITPPKHDYAGTFLCTLHYHQVRQKFKEHGERYGISNYEDYNFDD